MVDLPQIPGRFEVREELQDTALEHTLRAHDSVLQRDVMLKLPARQASAAWSAQVKERLLREARAVAKIRHEAIAPIHWVEETESGPLLVLDLPEGETLAERLEQGPLDPAETIALGIDIAEALAQVHYHSVVHRCIGPSSIRLLPNGKVQLGAFTFAKEYGSNHNVSTLHHGKRDDAAMVQLLPDYSAPEQMAGYAAEPRSDIFALGCTMFRCLAGKDPFEVGRESEPMPDLRKLRKDVDKRLAEVIRKCTMQTKTARFPTAQQVADALKELRDRATAPKGLSRTTTLVFAGVGVVCLTAAAVFVPELWADKPEQRQEVTRGPGSSPENEDRRYDETYTGDYKRVHGLFIGIGQAYANTEWQALKNPPREVQAIAKQLQVNDLMWQRPGAIDYLLEGEATADKILERLEVLKDNADKDDGVLIYFAGHGQKDGQSFGLCAADVKGDINTGTGYLRRSTLLTYLNRMKAKHALVILDCCHSGAVFADVVDTRGRNLKGPRKAGWHHKKNFSREFLCSAGADELAADGAEMSPFAKLLLNQLREPGDYLATKFLSGRIEEVMDRKVSEGKRVQVSQYQQLSKEKREGSFVFQLQKGK